MCETAAPIGKSGTSSNVVEVLAQGQLRSIFKRKEIERVIAHAGSALVVFKMFSVCNRPRR